MKQVSEMLLFWQYSLLLQPFNQFPGQPGQADTRKVNHSGFLSKSITITPISN